MFFLCSSTTTTTKTATKTTTEITTKITNTTTTTFIQHQLLLQSQEKDGGPLPTVVPIDGTYI
jgi:hypothetical protein